MVKIDELKMEKTFHYDQFYTLREYPVFMCTLTKAGCTFLKNLFYYIDHSAMHPLGDFIHQDESKLLRASEVDVPTIKRSPYVYMVVRDPVDRFLSLYYEKIYGQGAGSMDWFRLKVGAEIGMNFNENLSLVEHQENTIKLIKWLDRNLNGETNIKPDFHWRRQVAKWKRVSGFEPKILVLEDLDRQLAFLLSSVLPDISEKMKFVGSRNTSAKPFSFQETKTDVLVENVQKVYKQDFKLVDGAREYWQEVLKDET